MINSKAIHTIPEKHQSSWQLAIIQLSGWTSLPILATSILILQENSFLGAVMTIIVGNAILWFIRLGIIAMSHKKRQSTLDISRDYLGKVGSYFVAALLLICTLVWFITQTTAASSTLTHLISVNEDPNIDKFTQMSVFLGIVSTLLCMEGIVLLRKLSMLSFPILLVAFFIAFFTLPFSMPHAGSTAISLSGLTLILSANLGITSDLPTFFRHSQSWRDSIKALTIIQIVSLILALCSLYFAFVINTNFEINEAAVLSSGNNLLRISLITFVFFSALCANVANVYSASVGWEAIAPAALVGRKEYLILGLGLTTIFVLISDVFSVKDLLNVADSSLVNLCVTLIIGYIISIKKQKLPNASERKTYFIAWLLSTSINTMQFIGIVFENFSYLLISVIIILSVIFSSQVFQKHKLL
jgi:purine-cytosine permease-like protein